MIGWVTLESPAEVVPLGDLRPHHEGPGCWCRPLEHDDILLHNAADDRESYEQGRKLH